MIRITYASGKDEIGKKEIEALIEASIKLGCRDLLMIAWDYEDELSLSNRKIKFSPLWRWLTTG
ncbi:MAG: hypothetical protein QXN75_06860 [Thermoproteota archaeon]|nr:hypothetical protein [Candidatus Brockarchaeota archaeon]